LQKEILLQDEATWGITMGYDLQKGAFKIPRQTEPLLAFDLSELYSKPLMAEVIEARSIRAAMAFEARYNAARLQRLKDAIETLAPEETLSLDLEPQTARVFGYVRISTAEQDSALQRNALMELKRPPVEIIEDVMSGARADRPGLDRALSLLRPGDTLAIWKLDRLGPSLHSITESLDTSTPAGRVLFHVLGALAEFERDTIRDRVTAGMKAAKKAGKHVGRPARMSLSRTEEARRMLNEGKSWNKVCTTLEISQPTLSRALRKYGV
jgi:DNA invertase Pin-like site-specific DNA recombinase